MVEGEDALERQARFQRESGMVGARLIPDVVVSTENTINGLPGMQPRLAEAIRKTKVGATTSLVVGDNYVAVAYVTNEEETDIISELPALSENASDDYLRKTIRETLLREKALAFYQSEIKAPGEDYLAKMKAIMDDASLNTNAKMQKAMEPFFSCFIQSKLLNGRERMRIGKTWKSSLKRIRKLFMRRSSFPFCA